MNTFGQTKFTLQKQLQIQDMIRFYKSDIIHLQKTDTDSDTFKQCSFILNNYAVILAQRAMEHYPWLKMI